MDYEDYEEDFCPACDAENYPLGKLGRVTHYRCRACGMMWSPNLDPACPDPDAQREDRLDAAEQQQHEQDYYD